MRFAYRTAVLTATLLISSTALADTEIELIKQQLQALQVNYEQRIKNLEARLLKAEKATQEATVASQEATLASQKIVAPPSQPSLLAQNNFNPAITLTLDGRFASLDNDPDDYELPGFALGGESGLGSQGFSLGESELLISSNIDNNLYGQATIGFHDDDGSTEVDLEEAFIQTLGLGKGLTLKAGRFFSAIGYLNEQHAHAWDFADAPLIYRGLFGDQFKDDGLQVSYIAPTDTFLQLGVELLSGGSFPAGGDHEGAGATTIFANVGGDIGIEHSWQVGLNYWQSNDIEGRTSGGHSHGDESDAETPSFSGDSQIYAMDVVYKWAPNGNPTNQNLKLQFEYFDRSEDGEVEMLNSGPPSESTSYDGSQQGWYAQAIYQFKPQWSAGLRYDQLGSDNKGSDSDALAEAGLDNEGLKPKRISAMLAWLPSEFSRIRLQYNHDKSYGQSDNQIFLQYTTSIGSHGGHQY